MTYRKKSVVKALIFVSVLHFLTWTAFLIGHEVFENDVVSLFSCLLIWIISLPVYFFVKGDNDGWSYLITVLCGHLSLTAAACIVIAVTLSKLRWFAVSYWVTLIMLFAVPFLMLMLDAIIEAFGKKRKFGLKRAKK